MAKRLVKKGVTVVRDGKRVKPEIGKLFDFTKEEIDGLKEADPTALGSVEESKGAEEGEAVAAAATPSAEQSQAKARGGKKKATAAKSDAENAEDGDDGEAPEGDPPAKGGAGTDDDL